MHSNGQGDVFIGRAYRVSVVEEIFSWREFYGPDNEVKLADLVLALLDEELDDDSKGSWLDAAGLII
jgi:hypothetical protein